MSISDDPFHPRRNIIVSPSHLRQSLVFEDDDSSSVGLPSPSVELSSLLLPSSSLQPQNHLQEATSLVREHSSGRSAFVKRRDRIEREREREAVEREEGGERGELDEEEGGGGGGEKTNESDSRQATSNLNIDGYIPSPSKRSRNKHHFGGVLSSLLALQSHSSSSASPSTGSSSPFHSPPTTPNPDQPSSSRISLDDDEEENEAEARAKFIREKRLRRALEGGWLTKGGLVDAQLSPVRPTHSPRPTFSRSSSSGRSSVTSAGGTGSVFGEMMAASSTLSFVASPTGASLPPATRILPLSQPNSRPPSILQLQPRPQPSPRPILRKTTSHLSESHIPSSASTSSNSSSANLLAATSRSALTTPSSETAPNNHNHSPSNSNSGASTPTSPPPPPNPNRTTPTSPNLSFVTSTDRPILKKGLSPTSAGGATMKHVQVVAAEGIIHPLEVARSFAPEELLYPIVTPETMDEREERAWEKEKMRRRKAKEKKKREVTFITKHVADILARQDFILKLATAMMKFGAPSHRVDAQMQATARALDLTCQMVYLPGLMLISFGDPATHTSDTKFLKQENGLELSKLLSAHMLYWNVVHDRMAVGEASVLLEVLLNSKPTYSFWRSILIGGLCSAFIQPSAFAGSFIDCLVSIPLGMLLVVVQVGIVKMNGYLLLFEIVITMVNAFLAAALAATGHFCFASVASGSVVLVLPGYLFLAGSLELGNRAVVSGSTRLVFAIIYSLMLGFGLSIGSEVYIRVTGTSIRGSSDYTCSALRLDAPWYRATVSPYFYFLTIPAYTLSLAARNGQPLFRIQSVVMMALGSAGFSANYFSGRVFTGRPDITSTFGSFVVGVLGGIYGRFTRGSAFVVIVPGILLQLPSGMLQGGLLRQASDSTTQGRNSFASGYSVATQLISVSIGLSVGLFLAAAAVNTIGGGRKKIVNLSYF